jgi:hemolysin activation/secretion protein
MRCFRSVLGALLLLTILEAVANAQSESLPPDLPFSNPTEPTRPAPLDPPIPPIPPTDDPLRPSDIEEPQTPEDIPGADELVFSVDRIEVVGNTVLENEIAALVQPLEGQEVSLSQLLDLRTDITNLYVDNGYVTSGAFLPNNQDLTDGEVQIQVIEGGLKLFR